MEEVKTTCAACPARERSCFVGLHESITSAIDQIRVEKSFKAGEEIFFKVHRNADQFGFYCIQSGHIKLNSIDKNKSQRTIRICGPGDLIGYGETESKAGISYLGQALEAGTACYFDENSFVVLRNQFPEVSNGLVKMLCRIIRIKDERIIGLENHSVKNRVASLLLSLNRKFGVPSVMGSRIDLKIDRKTLAVLAGTVPQTFGRVLTLLEEEKIIHRKGRAIYIISLDQLRRVATDGR
jgi:CRP/FNR family transcriptional regulator